MLEGQPDVEGHSRVLKGILVGISPDIASDRK